MFKRITDAIIKSYRQETLAERSERIGPGAIYSALAAIAYVFVSSVINVLFFPGLHLAVDWISLLTNLIEFVIALSLAGAIVGWFTEEYMGIVGGGVVLTILLLVGNLIATLLGGGSAALTMQSFFTALPLVGAGVLLAGAIRMAINRHLHIKLQEAPEMHRRLFIRLTAIVIVVGLIPGVFSLFGTSSVSIIRTLNTSLQNFATDPLSEYRFPYKDVPALKNHFGMNYSLYARTSSSESGSMDITIRFEDRYTITCLVPMIDGSESTLFQICNEGSKIKLP